MFSKAGAWSALALPVCLRERTPAPCPYLGGLMQQTSGLTAAPQCPDRERRPANSPWLGAAPKSLSWFKQYSLEDMPAMKRLTLTITIFLSSHYVTCTVVYWYSLNDSSPPFYGRGIFITLFCTKENGIIFPIYMSKPRLKTDIFPQEISSYHLSSFLTMKTLRIEQMFCGMIAWFFFLGCSAFLSFSSEVVKTSTITVSRMFLFQGASFCVI